MRSRDSQSFPVWEKYDKRYPGSEVPKSVQRAFKPKQPSAGRASEASEGGGTSGHPGP